jgi:hypothetical protein
MVLRLHLLLSDPHTRESDLHDLLTEYPQIIDPGGVALVSEVKLGRDYRVDLAAQYDDSARRTMLVELERSDLDLFTKKGRFRAHVTHAIQQVQDWMRWWRENPAEVPEPFDSSVPPEGLVVIGRSEALSVEERTRLAHLNSGASVKVVTFDDLAQRLETIIVSLSKTDGASPQARGA